MAAGSADFLSTRKSLISRLKNWDDHESWNAFFSVYWRLIYFAGIRGGLTDSEAQDLVQETVISVCKAMPTFKYDPQVGSFKGWLLQLTAWRINDQLRRRMPESPIDPPRPDGEDSPAEIAVPVPPELERHWDQEWEGNLLQAAIERVKQRVDPTLFQIFDLFAVQQWPTEKIRTVLKVSAPRIHLVKYRVTSMIKKELRKLREELC